MLPHPALHASHGGIWIADGDGCRAVGRGEAIRIAADTPVILLGASIAGQRLGYADLSGLDLLELFAFVYPARFAVPTPKGLAAALGLTAPASDDAVAPFLREAATALLATLEGDWPEREGAWTAAQTLFRLRWPWGPQVTARLSKPQAGERWLFSRLPEWEEGAPRPAPRTVTLAEDAVADRLARLTGNTAERREGQRHFAATAAQAFAPRRMRDTPNLVLAEAGTGIGKTLGYLAPASLWTEAADGAVWVSTFTKALQRQLGHETARLYPDPAERRARVVTRKGRENYLCLLNLEDALQGGFQGRAAILAQLVARWAAYSADGDMVGGDLPGWLPT
ncbi:MAG TPA: ATP-dependent DNA helicase, partial [Sphingomonas sp.]|nr:ATP-dependent DNA helicase [Sphingomonas sp.]